MIRARARAGHRQVRRLLEGGDYQGEYFNTGPTMGRWVVNVWPTLEVISTVPYNHVYRFTTPDGAVHRLSRPYTA